MHVYDSMMEIDFDSIIGTSQKSKIKSKKASLKNEKDSTELWYCKDYNKGECKETSPHSFLYKGVQRQVLHICKKCEKEKREWNEHLSTADECPLKI